MKTISLSQPKSPSLLFDNKSLMLYTCLIVPAFGFLFIAQRFPEDNGIWWQNYYSLLTFGFILFIISVFSAATMIWRLQGDRITRNSFAKSLSPLPANIKSLPEWQQEDCYAHLQAWMNENGPEDKMIYKQSFFDQCIFVRDKFQTMLPALKMEVISTHTSKSIKLPVYHIRLLSEKTGDDIDLIMRCNFHDWKITVVSKRNLDFQGLEKEIFSTYFINDNEKRISQCYCEGFKEEWIFDNYNPFSNAKRFTIELRDQNYLFTFMLLLKYQLYPSK